MPRLLTRPAPPLDLEFGPNRASPQACGLLYWLPLVDGQARARLGGTGQQITLGTGVTQVGTPVVGRALQFNGVGGAAQTDAVDLSAVSIFGLTFWLYWDAYADDDQLAMEFS